MAMARTIARDAPRATRATFHPQVLAVGRRVLVYWEFDPPAPGMVVRYRPGSFHLDFLALEDPT
jgi:hypothetical protein